MPNQIEPIEAIIPRTIKGEENVSKRSYFKLTFHQLLSILITATVPVVIGIYTGIATYQQIKAADERRDFDFKQATELQRQHLYNNFINDIYQLHKDDELNHTRSPWAFANARFRVLHRQIDALRKAYILKFLKEKELIGRGQCGNGCEPRLLDDIIRLNELNFDGVQLSSETGTLNKLKFQCVKFDHASLIGATFANVDLSGTAFDHSQLNGVQFNNSLLACATFNGSHLNGTDFADSNLESAVFANVNLSTAKLTPHQLRQAKFLNVTMPNGTMSSNWTGTSPITSIKSTVQISSTMETGLAGGDSSMTAESNTISKRTMSPSMEMTSAKSERISISTTTAATTTTSTTTSTISTTLKATITTTTTTATTTTTVTTVKATTTRTTTETIINATAAASTTATVEKATKVSTATEVASTIITTTTRTTGITAAPTTTVTIGGPDTKTTATTNITFPRATTTTTLTTCCINNVTKPCCKLKVTIVEGRRLISEDPMGQSDPFVEIYLHKSHQKQETNVVQDNRNPVWNQTFTFDVHPQDDLIVFDVKDKDVSNHDMIGTGTVELKNVFDDGKFDEWVTIHVGSSSTGDIHVRMSI
ncbi:unnamed protein product [Rotaria socialis]|uniref:C2 domain-containing protein n=1 Tax=Rotaria socialis TaxID=392032 RepID=A0A820Q446_9BILA|nr:unnamed protein product [Rotaria socialis]CAF3589791.1 unnamed protein product [Rotaria socialis]CAF4266187.1 unnamed protein product [Rotaria socialis]CAF4412771.1 unnamed protein product [Rotaria socialis]